MTRIPTSRRARLSVVVPVFNNADTLSELVDRLLGVGLPDELDPQIEVCLVDDGSADDSWNRMCTLQEQRPDAVTIVRLSRNFGQVNALMAGFGAATGDAIIAISADLQDDPELLEPLTRAWVAGSDVAIAYRASREDSRVQRVTSRLAYSVARRGYPNMPQGGFDCFLVSRRAADALIGMGGKHRFLQGDVLWLGLPTAFVPYTRKRRDVGASQWTTAKRTKYFTDLLIDATFMPIKFISRIGMLVALLGIFYAVAIVALWIFGEIPIPGWAPLMVTMLLLGGLVMVMLGVVGEYVWRMADELRGRPPYLIAEIERSENGLSSAGTRTEQLVHGPDFVKKV